MIRGYRADVDPLALGLVIRAQLRLALDGRRRRRRRRSDAAARPRSPMVRAVSRVSGEDCFVADVICRRIEDVSALLEEIKATRAIQSSRTAFVLEQCWTRRAWGPWSRRWSRKRPRRS